jgi:hypothetical protein
LLPSLATLFCTHGWSVMGMMGMMNEGCGSSIALESSFKGLPAPVLIAPYLSLSSCPKTLTLTLTLTLTYVFLLRRCAARSCATGTLSLSESESESEPERCEGRYIIWRQVVGVGGRWGQYKDKTMYYSSIRLRQVPCFYQSNVEYPP